MTATPSTPPGLAGSVEGLTAAEAEEHRARDGPNRLPVPNRPSQWRQLMAQMFHFFALMLWAAGFLAIVAGMPQLGVAIFAVILVNGIFAFAQENRAERAAERLRDLLPRRATVVRDGARHDIDAEDLVVGDLVLLEAGDRVCADLRLRRADGVAADTSMLTGESIPARLDVGDAILAGSFVVEGQAAATVEATGERTRLASIAELTHAGRRPRSPLAVEIDRVVRVVAGIAVGVGAVFFGISLGIGAPPSDGFLFAIGVTVALVPEGLLPTVTLSLAIGAQRMADRHALVRRLESVETLGSTTFICTDKTGTLTRNEMAVVEVWTPAGHTTLEATGYDPTALVSVDAPRRAEVVRALSAAQRCSTGRVTERHGEWVAQGDPMEAAIDAAARRLGAPEGAPVERWWAFDPRRRRMSALAAGELVTKGAPDSVLARCLPDMRAAAAIEDLAARGLRVLAVASKPVTAGAVDAPVDELESGLELLGLIGLEDPPRDTAAAALAACRRAGIRVAMVTGDHPATARAVAEEVGLLGEEGWVLEGGELPPDDQVLGALLDRDGVVVARVDPETKLRIARALQARGHVVAMTGDGVNDGPALQAADIGIAMGRSGTDVARAAADLVLLDDDFGTVIAAVEQGRATFGNVHRFLTYHLTGNVAELAPFVVWALSGGRFPLAIGVLQILCLDIVVDLLPALALGGERPSANVLARPPERRHLIDPALLRRVFGVLGPTEAVMEMSAFVAALLATGWRPGDSFPSGDPLLAASGAAFSAIVISQCANAFACRSATRWPGALGWRTNPMLVGAVCCSLLALAFLLVVPPVASLLDQAPPPIAGLLVAVVAAPALLLVDALHKRHRRHRREEHTGPPRPGPSTL